MWSSHTRPESRQSYDSLSSVGCRTRQPLPTKCRNAEWEGLDVYAYAGMEEVNANFFNVGTTLFGLGNPGFSNASCLITTPSSFAGATPLDCIANNQRLSELTAGFWQNVYKGDYGRVTFGAQYEYIKRKAFAGIGGSPSTDNNIVMTSVRYYPF